MTSIASGWPSSPDRDRRAVRRDRPDTSWRARSAGALVLTGAADRTGVFIDGNQGDRDSDRPVPVLSAAGVLIADTILVSAHDFLLGKLPAAGRSAQSAVSPWGLALVHRDSRPEARTRRSRNLCRVRPPPPLIPRRGGRRAPSALAAGLTRRLRRPPAGTPEESVGAGAHDVAAGDAGHPLAAPVRYARRAAARPSSFHPGPVLRAPAPLSPRRRLGGRDQWWNRPLALSLAARALPRASSAAPFAAVVSLPIAWASFFTALPTTCSVVALAFSPAVMSVPSSTCLRCACPGPRGGNGASRVMRSPGVLTVETLSWGSRPLPSTWIFETPSKSLTRPFFPSPRRPNAWQDLKTGDTRRRHHGEHGGDTLGEHDGQQPGRGDPRLAHRGRGTTAPFFGSQGLHSPVLLQRPEHPASQSPSGPGAFTAWYRRVRPTGPVQGWAVAVCRGGPQAGCLASSRRSASPATPPPPGVPFGGAGRAVASTRTAGRPGNRTVIR